MPWRCTDENPIGICKSYPPSCGRRDRNCDGRASTSLPRRRERRLILAPGLVWQPCRGPRNARLVSGLDLLSYVGFSLRRRRGSQGDSSRQIFSNSQREFECKSNAQADLALLVPTYTFATPVLGGQLALSMMGVYGQMNTSIAGTLTAGFGGIAATRMGSISDSLTGSATCIRRRH